MGALCYPEFVLKPDSMPVGVAMSKATEMASPMRVAQETA